MSQITQGPVRVWVTMTWTVCGGWKQWRKNGSGDSGPCLDVYQGHGAFVGKEKGRNE